MAAGAQIADLTSERKLAANIREAYILCSEKQREAYVAYVLTMHRGRTLVFLNAISGVRRLAAILKLLGFPVQVRPPGLLRCSAAPSPPPAAATAPRRRM